eukprot:TRINITY_DN251_c0_g2_i2.p1 TRINITY_DN251_c0_g2~~TRINITY_DN251_c0_g2_i2.p1  ORF type:complete len:137 (+),score=19.23 TRINITY_DN251_c0_g2_i2:78-488(+)
MFGAIVVLILPPLSSMLRCSSLLAWGWTRTMRTSLAFWNSSIASSRPWIRYGSYTLATSNSHHCRPANENCVAAKLYVFTSILFSAFLSVDSTAEASIPTYNLSTNCPNQNSQITAVGKLLFSCFSSIQQLRQVRR